ncbi:isoprenoid synthase domain-containing protein [Xylaria intraflava]|nr:isoprenoid synthase domain-containing protein [Xylaria intraflava]
MILFMCCPIIHFVSPNSNIIQYLQTCCVYQVNMLQDSSASERVTVQIPDMFVSFLAEPPRVNPNYSTVKVESEAWISKFCSFDKRMSHRVNKCDFSYFIAVMAPEAPPVEFRTLCDWGNWVFPYDDMFDNGELRDKPAAAAMVMKSLMSPMNEPQSSQNAKAAQEGRLPIIKVHDTVWERVREGASDGVQRRFAKAMRDYCAGALCHVEEFSARKIPTPEEMLERRRLSAGVSPLFALVEYAHAIRIPDYVFEHPVIREFEQLGTDFVLIMNDILSYIKEEEECVPHNLVAVARMGGLGPQEAFSYIGAMLDGRYKRWEKAISEVPNWDDEIDKHVGKYIRGVADVVRANLNWSFKSQRYLGDRGAIVRETRRISVQRTPAFVHSKSSL